VAHDISGQGNNGTWSGTPSSPTGTHYTTGEIGSAAGYFNGTDNVLTIGTQPIYDFTGRLRFLCGSIREFERRRDFARENFNNNGNNGICLLFTLPTLNFAWRRMMVQELLVSMDRGRRRRLDASHDRIRRHQHVRLRQRHLKLASWICSYSSRNHASLVFGTPSKESGYVLTVPLRISASTTAPYPRVRSLPSMTPMSASRMLPKSSGLSR